MTQPDQGLGVELMRALPGQAQRRANLAVEERCMTFQPITGYDDIRQSRRQTIHQRQQRAPNGFCFPDDSGVRCFAWIERSLSMIATSKHLDGPPDVVFNARPGVGGEGEAPLWVKPQDRTPQTNATGLQGFFERQLTQHLLAHNGLNKTVVTRHQLIETLSTTSLRLDELGGLWRAVSEATPPVDRHRAPPLVEMPYSPL